MAGVCTKCRIRGLVIVLGLLIALELAGRLAGKPSLPPDPRFTVAREWNYPERIVRDHDLLWHYRPRQTIQGDFLAAGTYTINSRGFRTPEYADTKPAGTMRVVCLGESTTFGLGISDEAVWPRQLERQLNTLDPNKRRWEVLNLAVTDYSSYQGLNLARRELPRLRPDIVLLSFSWADHQAAGTAGPDADLHMPSDWRIALTDLFHRSALVRWCLKAWDSLLPRRQVEPNPNTSTWRVPPTEYLGNIEKICRTAVEAGAHPILVTSPISWPPAGYSDGEGVFHLHHRYRRLARYGSVSGGGRFAELANAFDEHYEFFDDSRRDFENFNSLGHAFAGEFLARYLLGAPADTSATGR